MRTIESETKELNNAVAECERFIERAKLSIKGLSLINYLGEPCQPRAAAKRAAIDAGHALAAINRKER